MPVGMTRRLEQLLTESSDVRVLHWILRDQSRVAEWANSIGVCIDELLRSFVPSFPPPELRGIVAAAELQEFLWTGFVDAAYFLSLYETHKSELSPSRPSILDFGCGCGRLTRFLAHLEEDFDVHATDINPKHVEWCQKNLRGVSSIQNAAVPPLPYPDAAFNFIFSLSVLTHLTQARTNQWLQELLRILAQGGILVVTTHGLTAVRTIRDSPVHQQNFGMSKSDAETLLAHLPKTGFAFRPYDPQTLITASAGSEYGHTFVHPDYIEKTSTILGLRVKEVREGGLRGWQDIVVLERQPGPLTHY